MTKQDMPYNVNSINFVIMNEEYIITEYQKGRTQADIANELGSYNTSIRRVLLRHGITLRSNAEIQRIVKSNIFENVNNPNVQYWLGLLATDGCVTGNRIVLELKESDKDTLEQYREFIGYPVSINKTVHKATDSILYRVAFKNDEIAEFLTNKGIKPNKSLDLELNLDFTPSLLRGIIDGDGGYARANTSTQMYIVGASEAFMLQIKSYLESLGFHPTLRQDSRGLYTLSMYRKSELENLHKLLYTDANYFLLRKFLKFGSLLGKPNK